METTMTVKMCVAGEAHNGKDLFYCLVKGTKQEYIDGIFHRAAKNYIESHFDVDAEFVCDQYDPCGTHMMNGCDWSTIPDPIRVETWDWE